MPVYRSPASDWCLHSEADKTVHSEHETGFYLQLSVQICNEESGFCEIRWWPHVPFLVYKVSRSQLTVIGTRWALLPQYKGFERVRRLKYPLFFKMLCIGKTRKMFHWTVIKDAPLTFIHSLNKMLWLKRIPD